ncbi:gene transfer agent family protein [Paracoccus liaowanqingii]|uniref:Gene transfer agent family protein n=1 Tax=Paracoccus liaowanqingii TaxID=2560053 RepID=A0A4P7HM73_9RHOB|nr:gene transfer agent family protein [Paracoccus liaowanqingii]QBX34407.1 gene transfer agent family protein [Paracoccus liaowanqingii]
MANALRGEVALVLDGQPHVARLTLGALAELEGQLQADGLAGLVARMDDGRFSSSEILAVVVAGLRGAGWTGQARDLTAVQIGGGPLEAARIAARLLALAFRAPE